LKGDYTKLENKSNKLRKEMAELKIDHPVLIEKSEKLDIICQNLGNKNIKLVSNVISLEKEYEGLENDYKYLAEENKTLENDAENLKEGYEDLQTKYKKLGNEN